MAAWLTTILRNLYRNERRKQWREIEEPEGRRVSGLLSPPAQEGCMALEEFRMAMGKVTPIQREALILVGAFGSTCVEAVPACGTAAGTVKSRVQPASTQLSVPLSRENPAASGRGPRPGVSEAFPRRGL